MRGSVLSVTGMTMFVAACGGGTATNRAVTQPAKDQVTGDCTPVPDFVPFHPSAHNKVCMLVGAVRPNHVSGTIMFITDLEKAQVIDWYRDKAHAAGLKDSIANPSADPMYSARDGDKRSMMVMTGDGGEEARTKVTITWGYDKT